MGPKGTKMNCVVTNIMFFLQPGSDVHLYQVSGTDVLRIKTTEVHCHYK